jgi:hypothetical protein
MVYREHVLGNRHRLWVLNATFNNTGGSRGNDRINVSNWSKKFKVTFGFHGSFNSWKKKEY